MKIRYLCAAAALIMAPAVNAATIDFESYADPTNFVSFTTMGATFTGIGNTTGFEISTYGIPNSGTGAPKILCPRTTGNYCGGDFEVTFASLATGLNFLFTGDGSVQPLTVKGYLGATLLGTVIVSGDGAIFTSHLVDLASLGGLDRIVVTGASFDLAGYGYDDFNFNIGVAGAVPEPATWAMMIGGFGGIGAMMRRRRRQAALA